MPSTCSLRQKSSHWTTFSWIFARNVFQDDFGSKISKEFIVRSSRMILLKSSEPSTTSELTYFIFLLKTRVLIIFVPKQLKFFRSFKVISLFVYHGSLGCPQKIKNFDVAICLCQKYEKNRKNIRFDEKCHLSGAHLDYVFLSQGDFQRVLPL